MPRPVTLAALASCLALAMLPAFCQQAQAPNAASFRLSLSPPSGWGKYQASRPPHRFGANLIWAWAKQLNKGTALVYVTGARREAPATTEGVADSFETFLKRLKIKHKRTGNLDFTGRPAVRFDMEGPGDGQLVASMSEGRSTKTPTQMSVIFTTNPWSNAKGTDIIQFVMACHKSDAKAAGTAFSTLYHGSRLLGRYDPAKKPAPPKPPATPPSVTSDDSEGEMTGLVFPDLPALPPAMIVYSTGEVVVASETEGKTEDETEEKTEEQGEEKPPVEGGDPAADNADAQGASATSESPANLAAPATVAVTMDAQVGSSRQAVEFVRGVSEDGETRWVIDSKSPAEVYVLITPGGKGVLVVPAAEVTQRAKTVDGVTILEFSKPLDAFRNAWDQLLDAH